MISSQSIALELAALSQVGEIGEYVRNKREQINFSGQPRDLGSALLAENTELIDQTVIRLFQLACEKAPETLVAPPDLAIVATGGYGRGELAPFSDVDLTFIPEREEDEVVNLIIKEMFQSVMDVFMYGAKMKVGYAYRLFADLGQLDSTTETALLDARIVAGDAVLFEVFRQAYRDHILTLDFLFTKSAERTAILAKKGGDCVFVIEPDIKEGAGGLRDAQCLEWFSEVLFGCPREHALDALVENELLNSAEAEAFSQSHRFLLTARNALHCSTRETNNILTTEKQERAALLLGYVDTPERPSVESFMAEYYKHAATIQKAARKVQRRCLTAHLELGAGGLSAENRAIIIENYDAAEKDPALPFHAVEFAQAYNLDYSEQFIEDIEAFVAANSADPNIERCRRVFARILQAPRGVSKAIRDLADFGALYWLLPELKPLRTLIPYDASHDYTVGEHSIRVVDQLDQLRYTINPKLSEYRRVWSEIDSPEMLYIVGLTHDMGKQWPEQGSHSASGAAKATEIAARLGWDDAKAETLAFLIQNHLLMAETSRLRDLRVDETLRDFTRIVSDTDRLNMLYVLTSADTHAVGDGIWTEMRSRFLSELYTRASMVLSAKNSEGVSEEDIFNNGPDLAKHRARIGKQLASHDLPTDTIALHMERMSAQYLLNTPIEEIHLHIAMIDRLRTGGLPMVDFKSEFGIDYTEMTIVAYDEASPGLLAKIVGVLYALDINLHGSRVFTREGSVSIAIDTLWMDFRGRPLSSSKRSEVIETMRSVLTSRLDLTTLFERRKKPAKKQVIHRTSIDDTTSDRYSILEVHAPDEQGVMYRLCAAVSHLKWNIQAARVSVWGSRVRAAFYITEAGGRKVGRQEIDKLYAIMPREEFNRRKIGPPRPRIDPFS